MSQDSRYLKPHEQFDWNTEENEAIQAATADAERLGLDSFGELLDTRPESADKLMKLIQARDPDIADVGSVVIGIISERTGGSWLFLQPANHLYEGADAIGISFEKSELSDTEPDKIHLDQDVWRILQKQPLLLRSIYGAILGFKNTVDGIDCVAIFEGHDGWA